MLGRFLALTSVGLVVYWFSRDAKTLKLYEQTFVDTYAPSHTNRVIPSPYHDSEDPQLLAKLCGRSAIRRNLVRSRPRIKIHVINFKRIRKPSLIAEVVRCTRNTGIVQAPSYNGHDCAYLLRLDRDDTPSFHIHRKFCYIHKKFHRIKRSRNDVKIKRTVVDDSHAHDSHEHDSHEHHSHEVPLSEHDYPDYVASPEKMSE